ncbi:hypothetical protein Q7C36_015973 [Tachysurus vachellii]|uniref:Uncharacterized protein n=1 Tax=Tachysurus vachellii TaxID=175792 RepID=A0AA88M8V8_TACVA|nr:hypothetical protein Q7C36_015973 [Tachysurus vachellii]
MGVFTAEGPSKSSLLSFANYAHSFNKIQSLLSYVSKNPSAPAASSEGDQLVGFGAHTKKMDDDDELESAMLNISPSKLQLLMPSSALSRTPTDIKQLPQVKALTAQKTSVALPKELITTDSSPDSRTPKMKISHLQITLHIVFYIQLRHHMTH